MAKESIKGTITYEWFNYKETSIKEKHIEALKESAHKQIFEMLEEGYTSGELVDIISMDKEDGEDGVGYTGSWELKIDDGEYIS